MYNSYRYTCIIFIVVAHISHENDLLTLAKRHAEKFSYFDTREFNPAISVNRVRKHTWRTYTLEGARPS